MRLLRDLGLGHEKHKVGQAYICDAAPGIECPLYTCFTLIPVYFG